MRSICASILLLLALLSAAACAIEVIETDEYIRLHNSSPSPTRLSNRTTLAYITPWNSKGPSILDSYSEKIDMVSPVWYTILVSPSTSPSTRNQDVVEAEYVLSGGPDEEWLKRKQGGVKIVPRFYLDNWKQEDYANLLSSEVNWMKLADLIVDEVEKRAYDGVVFESAATHLLYEPIRVLSTALKSTQRSLTLVLPPLRTKYSLGGQKLDGVQKSQNRMIVQSIPQLAQVVDFFSVMTYDMSSAMGRVSSVSGKDFPKDSPLRGAKRGDLRQPGPNTSPTWVRENLALIEEAVRKAYEAKVDRLKKGDSEEEGDEEVERLKDPSNPFAFSDFSAESTYEETAEESDPLALIRGKLLMGMPMYGYRYPLFWIDKSTGQGVPVPPPTTPSEAKQLYARSSPSDLLPFLRGPGEALTMDAIVQVLTDNDGVIVDPEEDDGEGWFDYAETVTKESLEGKKGQGVKEGDEIYWRLYLPLPSSTRARLKALEEEGEGGLQAGLSLWELGQASPLLLNDL